MTFATIDDISRIEGESKWEDRNLPVTLLDLLSRTAHNFPNKPAVSFQLLSGAEDKAETLTWAELYVKTIKVANMFRGLGVGENDVVAYVLPNANEAVLTMLGGAVAGIVNPINPLLDAEQIGAILRETNAKVVVTLKAFPKTDVAQKTARALALAPNVESIVEVDLLRYLTPPKSWIVPLVRPKNPVEHSACVYEFDTLLDQQNERLDFEDCKADRVAAYFHTGGTTGMPKIAQHRYSSMIYNGWIGHDVVGFNENDCVICPLPLFHVFACQFVMTTALSSGAHVVFPTPQGYRGDGVFDNFWKLIERWKVTFVITVPTAISALMQRPVDADISSVKTAFSGSAPLPVELFRRFEKTSQVNIIEGYGLTEATCLVSVNPIYGEKRIGSVGLRFPYTDIKIVKSQGGKLVECAPDEVGEVCVSSPGVFAGQTYTEVEKNTDLYYNKTYLRTGDLGRLDAEQYLWITGRAKDIIIRGGHNIDPAVIEEALLGHEAVAFAGAIGQPDQHAGELPCVYVELVEGADVSPQELEDFCRKHIPEKAAHPKHVEILAELPKTAVGKVFKPDLRKSAITRVLNTTFSAEGIQASVVSVHDDKKRGLVATISGQVDKDTIQSVLGRFAVQWEIVTE